ncbi:PPE domain-containing protein [Nocardia sp. NPDC101769]|uniref:PPE domain-containing protein n=1 Tax=Nocardia sp. NPDC101769 TaxID=3364333 RepID=UPI0038082DBE
MWPLFFASFTSLPPEENARRVLQARTSDLLGVSAGAYTVFATGLYTAATASYANTASTRVCWNGPAGDAACQALSLFSDWLHGQADNAMRTATVIGQVQAAAAAAEMAMAQVMLAAGLIRMAEATGTMSIGAGEAAHKALWAEAAGVMTTYAGAAGLALNTLPVSTVPPLIAKTPTALMEAGVSPIGFGDPLGLPGTGGHRSRGGGTSPVGTGGSPVSGPGGSSPISGQPSGGQPGGGQPGGGQPGGGQPGGGQPGGGQPGGGQPGGGQPGGGQPGGVDPGSGLPDPQQPSSEWQAPDSPSDSLPNFGDGTAGPDDQGLYGASPYSPTLAGLLGVGPGSTVTPAMTGGTGSVVSSGVRLPTAWRPATAQTFGAATESPAPQPVSPRQPPRGASAPEAQRRRERKDQRKRSATFVAGDGIEAPAADLPYLIEYEAADAEPISESEKVLAFGLLDQDLHSTTE